MYGRAEEVVGTLLAEMGARDKAFLATKVWTWGAAAGIKQMQASTAKLRAPTIDLMQVHRLADPAEHGDGELPAQVLAEFLQPEQHL